ncbi:MAG: 2-oxo acid dehydrogenase subunit E2, partial [Chthonomonas sp.]|nr:2-oxo acid dehydrogenase subunit E2 [Chthonomonas sp.]
IMPKMGDGMEEGTLVEWLKSDGSKVKPGEVIGTIQTDKATLELESPGSGILSGFLIQPGQTVPVGVPIAALLKDGEALPGTWGGSNGSAPAKTEPTPAPSASVVASVPAAPSGRIKASPLARKVAETLGIDLASVVGTGPGGRITESDVRTAKPGTKAPTPVAAVAPIAAITASAEDKQVPLNRLRQIIAERTTHSKQTVPHFYVTVEVDIEAIQALRDMFEKDGSGKVSINDFVVAASVRALQEMPEVNASFQGDHVLQYGAIHIGIAAAVEDGLLVPVIKNAHAKTLRQLSAESKELVTKARAGKLHPDEMSGSTFSISNMGMLDVDTFGAIINEPNCAIVAISSARKKPVVVGDDELEIRERMNITGSFDHRVVDGALGAKFVNVLRSYLENPTRLLS